MTTFALCSRRWTRRYMHTTTRVPSVLPAAYLSCAIFATSSITRLASRPCNLISPLVASYALNVTVMFYRISLIHIAEFFFSYHRMWPLFLRPPSLLMCRSGPLLFHPIRHRRLLPRTWSRASRLVFALLLALCLHPLLAYLPSLPLNRWFLLALRLGIEFVLPRYHLRRPAQGQTFLCPCI